jgi:predicted LPLAT superfamily acyltransferase
VPVVLGFGLYRGGNRYDLCFEAFQERFETSRAQRGAAVGGLIQRYARRLEHHARAAPYNWFNFYDFWHPDDATADLRHPHAPADDGLVPGGGDA